MTVIGGVYFRSEVSLNRAVILPRIVQENHSLLPYNWFFHGGS